jgi:hypothetical protein
MKARVRLLLVLAAVSLVWVGSASALSISFLEPVSPTANIDVSVMNLTTAGVVATSPELATLTVGTVTTTSTVLAQVGLTQPGSMHREGGGQGVSDLLTLRTFSVPGGALVGFQVSFQSDGEMGVDRPSGSIVLIPETGHPQIALDGDFTLPLVGSVDLTVTTQSDLDPVPEPSTLLLFGSSLLGMGGTVWRRYRRG